MQRASSDSQKFTVLTAEWPEKVKALDAEIEKNPRDARLWFERGLALGDARLMHDAITSFSRAIALDPMNGIYYRWRGHRHLNINQIAEACADLELASRLIPDNWDVWYHLGLVHVLLGNYELAELAYRRCKEAPTERDSNKICRTNWTYLCLLLQGKTEEAQAVLHRIPDDQTCDDYNLVYLEMLNYYKGRLDEKFMLEVGDPDADSSFGNRDSTVCTHGFGMAMEAYAKGDKARSRELLDYVLKVGEKNAWNTFGYQGAYYVTHFRDDMF